MKLNHFFVLHTFFASFFIVISSASLAGADTISFPSAAVGSFGQKNAGFSLVEGDYIWEVTSGGVFLGTPSVSDWALAELVGGTPGQVTITRSDVVGGLFTFDSFMLAQRDPTPAEDIKYEGFLASSSVAIDVFSSTTTYTLRTPTNLSSAIIDELVITLGSSGSNFAVVDDITVTSVSEPSSLLFASLGTLALLGRLRRRN